MCERMAPRFGGRWLRPSLAIDSNNKNNNNNNINNIHNDNNNYINNYIDKY